MSILAKRPMEIVSHGISKALRAEQLPPSGSVDSPVVPREADSITCSVEYTGIGNFNLFRNGPREIVNGEVVFRLPGLATDPPELFIVEGLITISAKKSGSTAKVTLPVGWVLSGEIRAAKETLRPDSTEVIWRLRAKIQKSVPHGLVFE